MKLVHILKSESKFVLIVFLSYVVYNNWPANLAARQENKATNCYEVYDSFDDSFDQVPILLLLNLWSGQQKIIAEK